MYTHHTHECVTHKTCLSSFDDNYRSKYCYFPKKESMASCVRVRYKQYIIVLYHFEIFNNNLFLLSTDSNKKSVLYDNSQSVRLCHNFFTIRPISMKLYTNVLVLWMMPIDLGPNLLTENSCLQYWIIVCVVSISVFRYFLITSEGMFFFFYEVLFKDWFIEIVHATLSSTLILIAWYDHTYSLVFCNSCLSLKLFPFNISPNNPFFSEICLIISFHQYLFYNNLFSKTYFFLFLFISNQSNSFSVAFHNTIFQKPLFFSVFFSFFKYSTFCFYTTCA